MKGANFIIKMSWVKAHQNNRQQNGQWRSRKKRELVRKTLAEDYPGLDYLGKSFVCATGKMEMEKCLRQESTTC